MQRGSIAVQGSVQGKRVIDLGTMLASPMVLAAGILALVAGILHPAGQLYDFIDEVYLIFFGLIMFVIDNPIGNLTVAQYQQSTFTYALFLRLMCGIGLWYIYL